MFQLRMRPTCKPSPSIFARMRSGFSPEMDSTNAGTNIFACVARTVKQERWTISKAIALLLKGGVPEEEIVEMVLRHLGRHIASSDENENGGGVSRLINGLR